MAAEYVDDMTVPPPPVPVPATTASKFLALKAAGFTNRDIIEAHKSGQLEELLALVEEAQ